VPDKWSTSHVRGDWRRHGADRVLAHLGYTAQFGTDNWQRFLDLNWAVPNRIGILHAGSFGSHEARRVLAADADYIRFSLSGREDGHGGQWPGDRLAGAQ